MEYVLTCTCGRQHTVTNSQAGQELECECGKRVSIPTLRGLSQLPPALEGNQPPSDAKQMRSEAWGGWRGPTMALACAGLLISLGFTTRFVIQRIMAPTDYTSETEIARGDEMFDTYSPEDLSLVWENYREVGLGMKERPPYYLWQGYALARVYLAIISGSIAAVCGAVALGIWLSARKKMNQA